MILSPVRGSFKVAQKFWANPKIYKKFWLKAHNWLDIQMSIWTPLYAPMDWLTNVKSDKWWYGEHISLYGMPYNTEGDYRDILLAHFSEIVVKDGDSVKAGDLLWYSGNSWFSFWNGKEYPNGWGYPHLHFSLRRRNNWKVINYDNGYYGSEDIFGKWYIMVNEVSKY